MLKMFFVGDSRIMDAETYLKYSVEEYNTALYNMNFRVVIKMYEILKGENFILDSIYIIYELISRYGGSRDTSFRVMDGKQVPCSI